MTKHKLDDAVEELLKHHGILGMKWGVRRTDAQIAAAGGGGGDDEEDEDEDKTFSEEIENLFKNIGEKMSDISDAIKAKGKSLLTSIFGESKPTYSIAKPNDKLTKAYREAMQKTVPKDSSDRNEQAVKNAIEESKKRGERAASSNKSVDAILDGYKKQGYKKVEKSKPNPHAKTTVSFANKDGDVSKAIESFKEDVKKEKEREKKR